MIKSFEEIYIENTLYREYGIRVTDIKGIYLYGSHLYGTASLCSDYDFVVIVSDSEPYTYYSDVNIDIHIYNEEEFNDRLRHFKWDAVECILQNYSLTKKPIKYYINYPDEVLWELDKWEIRKSISAVVNNSWVKAKKKIIKENEVYIGVKSLSHSLRLLDYGIQLGSFNNQEYRNELSYFIFDRFKEVHKEIMRLYDGFVNDPEYILKIDSVDDYTDIELRTKFWELLESKFKHNHNENVKFFRTLCPKPDGVNDDL